MKGGRQSDLRTIALSVGLHERAIERLLGSVGVPCENPSSKSELKEVPLEGGQDECVTFDIGLRMNEVVAAMGMRSPLLIPKIKEYLSVCPVVVGWIARGDFNPNKPPKEITRARLLHASRTAGRLRAQILRGTIS